MLSKTRTGKFTASEIWKLFVEPKTKADKEAGVWSETSLTYIMEKAVEEVTGWRKEFSSKATDHGLYNEQEAFDAFKTLTGLNFVMNSSTFLEYGQYAGASPDGILYDGLDIIAVMDVKCPYSPVSFFNQKIDHLEGDNVPREYFYQLQMQMMVTGCDTSYLCRYLTSSVTDDFGNKFEFDLTINSRLFYTTVKKDQSVWDAMEEKIMKAQKTKERIISQILK